MKAIVNGELVMRDHLVEDGVVLIENGIIAAVGDRRSLSVPEGCEIIDAQGAYVGPGLVDIHTHAGEDVTISDEPYAPCQAHLKAGTTTLLAALYFNSTKEQLLEQAARVRAAIGRPGAENLTGFYMEAPYMNPKFGADRANNPWKGPVCKEDYQPIIDAVGDKVFVWAVAPERENIVDFVRDAKAANPSVRFAVGHSEAEPHQIEALMPYGLCIGTHHTNATGTIVKYPECRGVCVDETVSYNHDIYAELICDSVGIHVDPYMLRLVRKIKGDDRVILISDQCAGVAPAPAGYEHVHDINFDFDGEIYGSRLTLNVACRNMMKHTGASIVDVFRFASYNPARAVGLYDRGEIAVGKRADLLVCDYKMNVKTVFLAGKEMN
ncbi:MAG: amidohydrolase family protein [Oscillospiraceae bacterium]|nr:amidohydrolase family protein [Oscillospiraceae bacterium]